MDAAELREQLQLFERQLENLVDKLVAAIEAGDAPLTTGLVGAVKVVRAQQRGIRRRLTLGAVA
jgi:hypothetical protein